MGICCMTQGTQTGARKQRRGVDAVGGGRDVQVGGHMGKSMADSG